MADNNPFSIDEQYQIRHSREYQDRYPAGAQAESGIDLTSDLNHVFSAIKRVIHGALPSGVGNWYDAPSIGISGLHQMVLDVSTPTWNQVFDNSSGILNVDIFNASIRLNAGRNWKFTNGAGASPIMTVSLSGVTIRNFGQRQRYDVPTKINPGATITIPNAGSYTPDSQFRNLKVYRNGDLLNPGSGITSANADFRDYREASATTIVTNSRIFADEILQFIING